MKRARTRAAAAIALLALASVNATAATADTAAGVADRQKPRVSQAGLKVLSHNVFMLPPIAGGKGNDIRAQLIAQADYLKGQDVVVLQEAFDNGPSTTLKNGLAAEYPYQTPVLGRSKTGWDETLGAYSWLTPEDGGVTIVSRWPIQRKIQYVYDDGCGADWFSNKGFVYVQLNVNGTPVHVVGTHAQATDSLCSDAAGIRKMQFTELDSFLDGLQLPADQPVVIAGDLNVDRGDVAEYTDMLATLDVVPPAAYGGHPNSWDPSTNSLTAVAYPGYPAEHLDYVLYRRTNQGKAWSNTVLTPVSPEWSSGGQAFDDYSDHYPVAAR